MLAFAQAVVAFLAQGDHLSNVPEIFMFASVSFSRYNLFPLAIFPNCYKVYQNFHYMRSSY